ncbi:GNAT family N-acetyltransferase [Streptomyces sp. NPDC051315]|uniref:GNAT family N-acetyltransferase n=1 Tax=Streptomyces sp. NPDC051315 TaxID=3365650 RepID=UPI0037904F67
MTTEGSMPPGVEMRAVGLDDARELAEALARNREYLLPWEPDRSEGFFTEAGQRSRLANLLALRDADRAMQWLLTEHGQPIGAISLSRIILGPLCSASIGYWVDRERAGRGIATAAVEAVCQVAREEFSLHRIEAGTLPENGASQRVLEKCGFALYGRASKYLYVNGAWRDHILYQRILHNRRPDIGESPPVVRD